MPEISEEEAKHACLQLLKNVANTSIQVNSLDLTVSVTVSIGLTKINNQDKNIEQALSRADKALYQAKDNGRNTISIFNGDE